MYWLIMAHNVMRWAILVAAVATLAGALAAGKKAADGWAGRAAQAYTVALDVQVLIGLVIWLLRSGWNHDAFLAFIHPGTMILAMLVAHFGRTLQKRSVPVGGFVAFLVSLVLVIAAIPRWAWPV
ncbi:hypothetical protein [Symbiobacterium thermophilum]|uniref:Uncharacterized protein n=1 Tax=Symbiobacterium thermophilum TaxID=2734 RepID=A0A953LFP3_SYMTR|nr:hypothetical protein [Symbiobacterium thermophilum]MBY6275408.1 hypothetical protein [Symbiobacterium thermophilum]